MNEMRITLRGRSEARATVDKIKEIILSNGKSEFEPGDTCCYGDFIVQMSRPDRRSSLVIVVNEPEGVFVQFQQEPHWKPRVLVDAKHGGLGVLCDAGGQSTQISARFFVPPESAWKGVRYFMETGAEYPYLGWENFDLTAEGESVPNETNSRANQQLLSEDR